MDMMMHIYNELIKDEYIREKTAYVEYGVTKYRIKFYEYPESGDVSGSIIIIDSLSPPLDSDFGDDEPLAEEYLYQIDVWTKEATGINARLITKELAKRVKKALRKVRFGYFAGGIDEYDKASKIYRDARRYRGKAYTEEVEALM